MTVPHVILGDQPELRQNDDPSLGLLVETDMRLQELSTELEGDLDVRGLLGLDDTISPGYERIRIRMSVKADCSDEELDNLLAYTQQYSPVCNMVCREVRSRRSGA